MASNPRCLTYRGITVYRELRDNHRQSTTLDYWYSLSPAPGSAFDIRDLSMEYGSAHGTREDHKEMLKNAIDDGALPGMKGPPDVEEGGNYTVQVTRTVSETTSVEVEDADSAEDAISEAEARADNIPVEEWDAQVIRGPEGSIDS